MWTQTGIRKFIQILRKASENLLQGTTGFREFLMNPGRREKMLLEITRCRSQARTLRAEAIHVLARADSLRQDPRLLERLIEQICALPARIEKAAARAKTYRMGAATPGLAELAGHIEHAARIVLEMVGPIERDDPHELARISCDLNASIRAAETVGNRLLSDLFEAPGDPLEVLKGQDFLHRLGDIVRGFRDIARRIETLIQGAG